MLNWLLKRMGLATANAPEESPPLPATPPVPPAPTPTTRSVPSGPSTRPRLTQSFSTGAFRQQVAGESFYQEAIARAIIAAEGMDVFDVFVIAETDNPYDAQAVAVLSESGSNLGHLPRPVNTLWWDELKTIQDGGQFAVCKARVIGGDEGRSYGLLLDMPVRNRVARSAPKERTYEDAELEFAWTYNGETVELDESAWQHREPDTDRPLALDSRRYTELSPRHVSKLLKAYGRAKNKLKASHHLFRALEAAAAPCNEGPQATALALLLTQQYRDECFDPDSYRSAAAAVMRSKMLGRAGRLDEALEVVREALTWATWPHGVKQLQSRLKTLERRANPKASRPSTARSTSAEP